MFHKSTLAARPVWQHVLAVAGIPTVFAVVVNALCLAAPTMDSAFQEWDNIWLSQTAWTGDSDAQVFGSRWRSGVRGRGCRRRELRTFEEPHSALMLGGWGSQHSRSAVDVSPARAPLGEGLSRGTVSSFHPRPFWTLLLLGCSWLQPPCESVWRQSAKGVTEWFA